MTGNAIPSDIVLEILVAEGIGIFQPVAAATDWVIVVGHVVDQPNRTITIFDGGGFAPEPGLDINRPSIQIVVRSQPNGYRDGYRKCLDIKRVLLGRQSETHLGDILASVTMPNDILPLGVDENRRHEFSMNFALIIHQGDLTGTSRLNTGV